MEKFSIPPKHKCAMKRLIITRHFLNKIQKRLFFSFHFITARICIKQYIRLVHLPIVEDDRIEVDWAKTAN